MKVLEIPQPPSPVTYIIREALRDTKCSWFLALFWEVLTGLTLPPTLLKNKQASQQTNKQTELSHYKIPKS